MGQPWSKILRTLLCVILLINFRQPLLNRFSILNGNDSPWKTSIGKTWIDIGGRLSKDVTVLPRHGLAKTSITLVFLEAFLSVARGRTP